MRESRGELGVPSSLFPPPLPSPPPPRRHFARCFEAKTQNRNRGVEAAETSAKVPAHVGDEPVNKLF